MLVIKQNLKRYQRKKPNVYFSGKSRSLCHAYHIPVVTTMPLTLHNENKLS